MLSFGWPRDLARTAVFLAAVFISGPCSAAKGSADLHTKPHLDRAAWAAGNPATVSPAPVLASPGTPPGQNIPVALLPGLPEPFVATRETPRAEHGTKLAPGSQSRFLSTPDTQVGRVGLVGKEGDAIGPVALLTSVRPASGNDGAVLTLPADRQTGAAVFLSGNLACVVLDRVRPLDLSGIAADPTFGRARLTLLPGGALLTVPIQPGWAPWLRRDGTGWSLSLLQDGKPPPDVIPRKRGEGLFFPMAAPSRTLVVPDPTTNSNMLVGTVLDDETVVPQPRLGPGYMIRPARLGLSVERLADGVELRRADDGFLLILPPDDVPHGDEPGTAPGSSSITDLRPLAPAEMRERLKASVALAAALPLSERFIPRLDAAEMALGLADASLAHAIAQVAGQDEPRQAASSRLGLILRASALLNGDAPPAPDNLDDDRSEAVVWRSLAALRENASDSAAAEALANRLPVLQAYPAPLLARIRAELCDRVLLGESSLPARLQAWLEEDKDGALLHRARFHPEQTSPADRTALLRLRDDANPLRRERAAEILAAIGLETHAESPAQVADQLEAAVLDARMVGRENALLLRIATLQAEAGQTERALAAFRQLAGLKEPVADTARTEAAQALLRLAGRKSADVSALADAATVRDNLDLVTDQAMATKIALALAQRLEALDLPDRAAELVQAVLAKQPGGVTRAELGAHAARLALEQGDAPAVRQLLDETDTPDLPPALLRERTLLAGRGLMLAGDRDGARKLLEGLSGADVLAPQIDAAAARQNWAEEDRLLAQLAAIQVPSTGKLPEKAQDLLVRWGAAASRANDEEALHHLREEELPRMVDPSKAAILGLLTHAEPAPAASHAPAGELAQARLAVAAATSLRP